LGEGFFSAGLQINHVIAEHIQSLPSNHGIAGLSQSSFNNQGLFADFSAVLDGGTSQVAKSIWGGVLGDISAHKFSVDSDASSSSDSHAIQPEIDSLLRHTEESTVTDVVEEINAKSGVGDYGAAVYDSAISVSNLNVGSQPSSSSSDGTSSDSEIFKLQVVTLGGLTQQPSLFGERGDRVGADILATLATPGQRENQNNQSTLQHSLSFGTLTLPPDG
jgi:hypothetical protein